MQENRETKLEPDWPLPIGEGAGKSRNKMRTRWSDKNGGSPNKIGDQGGT
jgi:hypothetical protein